MNNNVIDGKWKQVRGQAKYLWGKISDDDMAKIGGRFDKLIGQLQVKYGYVQDKAGEEIKKRTK